MTRQFHALERSLRDGSPDESGYVAIPVELGRSSSVVHSARLAAPRRPQALIPTSWLVVMVAIALVLGGMAILGRPGDVGVHPPQASPGAIPVPPLTETFVSPRNGFSVRYPRGWDVTPATTAAKPNTIVFFGSHALDQLVHAGEGRLVVSSRRLVADETEQSWIASFVRSFGSVGDCAQAPASAPRLPIDGRSGYLDIGGCPVPADERFSVPDVQFHVIVFAGGRVYEIGLDGNVDFAYFRAILDTIHLDPTSAVDGAG